MVSLISKMDLGLIMILAFVAAVAAGAMMRIRVKFRYSRTFKTRIFKYKLLRATDNCNDVAEIVSATVMILISMPFIVQKTDEIINFFNRILIHVLHGEEWYVYPNKSNGLAFFAIMAIMILLFYALKLVQKYASTRIIIGALVAINTVLIGLNKLYRLDVFRRIRPIKHAS